MPTSSDGGMSQVLGGKLSQAKNFVLGRKEPEPQGWLSVFNFLSNSKSYMYGGIAFAVAALFGFLSVLMLSTIVFAPEKFVLCFTLTVLALMVGMAFLSGPRMYVKNLFRDKNLIASIVLLTSLVLSLYFSMIAKSYLMSILMCLLELNAILYFFCNTTAISLSTIKTMLKGAWMMLTSFFRSSS